MLRQTATGALLAERLRAHPAVGTVRYPGLGGLLSFDVADAETARRVETSTRVIVNASSLGGVTTLIESRRRWEGDRVPPGLLRSARGWRIPRRSGPTSSRRSIACRDAAAGQRCSQWHRRSEYSLPRTTRHSSTPSPSCWSRTTGLPWPDGPATGSRRSSSQSEIEPDAIVMDIEMPVADGVEATRRLRTVTPGIPIVAVSGHDYEERVLEIRRAGADDYVRKAPNGGGAGARARRLARSEQNAHVTKQQMLAAVRTMCLGLPETSERPSHGAPTFFIRDKRSFATVWNNHHGDGRYALICAAPAGMQSTLVEADPERFYVPPYVGHRGWIGVRLDRGFDRDEIAGILEDAFAEVAPPKLVEAAVSASGTARPGSVTRTRRLPSGRSASTRAR